MDYWRCCSAWIPEMLATWLISCFLCYLPIHCAQGCIPMDYVHQPTGTRKVSPIAGSGHLSCSLPSIHLQMCQYMINCAWSLVLLAFSFVSQCSLGSGSSALFRCTWWCHRGSANWGWMPNYFGTTRWCGNRWNCGGLHWTIRGCEVWRPLAIFRDHHFDRSVLPDCRPIVGHLCQLSAKVIVRCPGVNWGGSGVWHLYSVLAGSLACFEKGMMDFSRWSALLLHSHWETLCPRSLLVTLQLTRKLLDLNPSYPFEKRIWLE